MDAEKTEIRMSAELLEFARNLVDGQTFTCIDDVVVEALRRIHAFVQNDPSEQEWLKAEVAKGIAEFKRGELVDEATVFDELDEILARKAEPAA